MSTEGPNYEVKELSKEFADQNVTIIGTMYKSKMSKDVVLLFVLIDSNNLVVFELQREAKNSNTFKTVKTRDMDTRDYRTVLDKENMRKEDIYL